MSGYAVIGVSSPDYDASVRACRNRQDMAAAYAILLREYGPEYPGWPQLNAAILRRWSPSGLAYIKRLAWQMAGPA